MIVVADSGPLHYLILLEHIELLRRFYGQVLVPEPVANTGRAEAKRRQPRVTGTLGMLRAGAEQVASFQCEDARADILYVELDKDPKHYTPTTLYDDRAITPSLFHWESQSRTRADSGTGRRYRASAGSDWRILLFVRHKPDDARGFKVRA